jgi:ribose 5-phosphate isomerase B
VTEDALITEVVRRVLREAGTDAALSAGGAALPAAWPPRRVAIGCDHGGVDLKQDLATFLRAKGYAVTDCGTHGKESVDYPDFAAAVARQVSGGQCEAGIVIDAAGIGSAIAANKLAGVRCATCHDLAAVRNSREHNDANVLSLGAKVVPVTLARRMVDVWLRTAHGGGRHLARVRKIMELES